MSNNSSMEQFTENPVQYLTRMLHVPPSRDAAAHLAGIVAASFRDATRNNNNVPSQTAALYLQAAARHLPATIISMAPAVAASSSTSANGATSSSTTSNNAKAEVEAEMQNTQVVFEIVEAVGNAVTLCQPRSLIAQSGILPVLANVMSAATTTATTTPANVSLTLPGPVLSVAHVEFLQAAIYAGHYAYAERIVTGTWPRPNATVSVRNVLRYFYLRGVVHLACQHLDDGARCFRTCLAVPSTHVVSAIAVAAWKKLVLLACLQQSSAWPVGKETKPFWQLLLLPNPTTTPTCVQRYLNSAVAEAQAAAENSNSKNNAAATTTTTTTTTTSSSSGTPASAAAPEDAASVVHLVDNLETGEPLLPGQNNIAATAATATTSTKYPALGVGAYATMVQAFVDMDKAGLAAKLEQHQSLLQQDGNWGLAHQVASELPCRQLYSWSRVYSSISLTELARLLTVSAAELEGLLVRVSISKQWPIQVMDGSMVTFPRQEPSCALTDSSLTQELVALAKLVQKMDATLSSSSKFLSLARKEGAAGGEGGKGGAPSGPRGVEDI